MPRSVRPWIALLGLLLVVSMLPGPLGAQTVPPVPTPEAPIPPDAPPVPTPVIVTTDSPYTTPIDPQLGLTVSITATAESTTPLSVAFAPQTLQNLTDINGVPVVPARLEIQPFSQDAAATIGELPAAALADTATLERRIGDVIRIQLYDAAGNVIQRPNFDPPVTLCFTPSAEQIAAVGGIGNLSITTFDSLIGAWTSLATTVIDTQICASITHLSFFILTEREVLVAATPEPTAVPALPVPARLPNTGAAGMMPEQLIFLAVLLALPLAMWLRRSVR